MQKKYTEEQLVAMIADANSQIIEARRQLSEAKKKMYAAESDLITAKLNLEKWQPLLDEAKQLNNPTPPTLMQEDIADFSEKFPELVEFAKQRDGITKK